MKLVINKNYDEISNWTANYVAGKINEYAPTQDRPFVMGLPTGSTPIGMYNKLIEMNREGRVSFKNVVTFNMDEYVGVSKDHPQSYHHFMFTTFFDHVDIDKKNVHILDGNSPDLEKECADFEAKIASYNGIRLFLGGMGTDGHLAFNVPGSSLNSRTRLVNLNYDTIMANSRFFDNDLDKVPKQSLTVGVQTVLESHEVVIMVSGYSKARALRHVVEEGINHMWTLSALQNHPHGMIVCDEDATMELKVGTVKYFRDTL